MRKPTDWFAPRRLIALMEDKLRANGFAFREWSERGEDGDRTWEFTFTSPDGQKYVTTGITEYQVKKASMSLVDISVILSSRIIKKLKEAQ